MEEPIAAPCTCSQYLPWKRKYVFLWQISSVMMFWIDMPVLWYSVGSCVNFAEICVWKDPLVMR